MSKQELTDYLINSFECDEYKQFCKNLIGNINTKSRDRDYPDALSGVCKAILSQEIRKYPFADYNIGDLQTLKWNKEKFRYLAEKTLVFSGNSLKTIDMSLGYCQFLTLVVIFTRDDRETLDWYLGVLSSKKHINDIIEYIAAGYYKSDFEYKELLDLMTYVILYENYNLDFVNVLGNSTVTAVIKRMDKTSVVYKGLAYKIKSLGLKGSYGI